MIALNKLNPQDIDEKIRLNEKDGVDIYQLRDLIKEELKDFQWIVLRGQVQCQCYVEQLAHIEKRIADAEQARQDNIIENLGHKIGEGNDNGL